MNHSTVLDLRSDRLKVVAQLKAAQVSQVLSILLSDVIVLSSRNFIHTLLTTFYSTEQPVDDAAANDFQMILQTTDNSIAGAIYSYNATVIVYRTNNESLPVGVTLPQVLFPLNGTVRPGDLSDLNSGSQIIRGPRMVNGSFYLSITRTLALQGSEGLSIPSTILGYLTIVSKAASLLNVVKTTDLEDGSRMSLIKLSVNTTRSKLDKNLIQNVNYTYVTPSLMCPDCYNDQFPLKTGTPEYLALVNGTSGAIIKYEFPGYGMVSTGYAPVSTFWQIWGVVVFQPHKYVYGPIRTIQNISITAVFSIGAGVCILTLLLSGWVLRPITRLQAATEQSYGDSHHSRDIWSFVKRFANKIRFGRNKKEAFKDSEVDNRIYDTSNTIALRTRERLEHYQEEIPEFRLPEKVVTRKYIRDELTELTETFNEMTIELRNQYRNLEDRVQQRKKEIKSAKLLAETANEAKSLFIANITHELRTPLNGILGMASVAMEENDSSSVRDSLKVIFKSGELLLRLLTDLLSFSKSEVDNMKLEIKGFRISEVVTQLHAIFDESSKAGKIRFSISMTSDWLVQYELDGDINRILQVVINLVSNSLKFTPAGGFVKVIISTVINQQPLGTDEQITTLASSNPNLNKNLERDKDSLLLSNPSLIDHDEKPKSSLSVKSEKEEKMPSDGMVTISFAVCDSGSGIAPHLQSRVFEPFVQGEIGAKETRSGAGLGLSICRHLAILMDGTIKLESEVGTGSCFTFTVPLHYNRPVHKTDGGYEDAEPFFEFQESEINTKDYVKPDISNDTSVFQGNGRLFSSPTFESSSKFNKNKTMALYNNNVSLTFQEKEIDENELENENHIQQNEKISKIRPYTSLVNLLPDPISDPNPSPKNLLEIENTESRVDKHSMYTSLQLNIDKGCSSNVNSSIIQNKKLLDPRIYDNLRVLIAEDNRVNQEVMVKMLHLEGIKRVEVANDGIEAVQAVKNLQELIKIQEKKISSLSLHNSDFIANKSNDPEHPKINESTVSVSSKSKSGTRLSMMASANKTDDNSVESNTSGFDIIFMDIQMPNLDGIQATERIRQDLGYKGPIIAVSAYTDKSNIDRCLEAGVNDFLGKPLRRKQLHAMLVNLVELKLQRQI